MERIAERKLHFAPYVRQHKAIQRLLREGRFRNVTEFLRSAIDHYLDNLGRPPLSEQARQMAEELLNASEQRSESDPSLMQVSSMSSDETW
jgi:Arc/MetJ-type ribon-helix-helix transcriptional regulator